MPKVGIVISNYNGWQDTVQCLQSLENRPIGTLRSSCWTTLPPMHSVDGGLRAATSPPNTVFLPQQQNQGFAAVNNIGMRRALADGCDWALLLNNDTVAAPDFLETLLRQTPEAR